MNAKQSSRRANSAKNAPKGSNPFSQPRLFARPSASKKTKSVTRTAAASAYSKQQRSLEPSIRGSFKKTNIRHRELISSVTGTVAFTVASTFALNPGISATFPWLSTQALGWEQYKFNKLKFCYYTRTGTATPGSVLLVPDYDAADAAPASEQIASAYRDVVEEVPWVEEFSCVLDPRALNTGNSKFIRTTALASNLDIKTYDSGNLHLCTLDGTAVSWGKLWVEYDVDLMVPQLSPTGPSALAGSAQAAGGSIAAATPFGAASTIVGSYVSSTASAVVSLTGMTVGQKYLVSSQGVGTVISAYGFSTPVGLTLVNSLFSGFPAAATTASASATYTATATTGSLTLAVTATTLTAQQLQFSLVPSTIAY